MMAVEGARRVACLASLPHSVTAISATNSAGLNKLGYMQPDKEVRSSKPSDTLYLCPLGVGNVPTF